MSRTIEEYAIEGHDSIERKDYKNAARCFDAILNTKHDEKSFINKKQEIKGLLERAIKQILPSACYMSGMSKYYGKTNSEFCAISKASIEIEKAGVTMDKLKNLIND